jgi:diguanylate cyclase (GGDEF)-like protein
MDPQSSSHPASPGGFEWPGPPELEERLREEIGRAERHGTPLSCLLVVVENLDEMAREHGTELREQTLAYIAAALRNELRNFDRVGMPSEEELLIVLPGADGPRAEIVARRVLDRLQAIKVEARGQRRALRISVGLAAWREGLQPEGMIERGRAATARSGSGEEHTEMDAGPLTPRPPGGQSPWEPPAGRA